MKAISNFHLVALTRRRSNFQRSSLPCLLVVLLTTALGCGPATSVNAKGPIPSFEQVEKESVETVAPEEPSDLEKKESKMETATFGAGCFWCVEAVFQKLKGVSAVRSGYMGGRTLNPTYEEVCDGLTGHAEVIEVDFDPSVISFAELLEVFWSTHDPTTLNRQGNDVGTQYRSAVFYHSEEQRDAAESYKQLLTEKNAFSSPVVTEITEASKMYVAEDYHQNYFNENPNNPYCRMLIPSKLEKLKKVFADKLK